MTERKPQSVSFESWIDKQIREATERGAFDDLPGTGKPIPGAGAADDENWWIRGYVEREGVPSEALLPLSLRLRAELEKLPATVRELRSERAVRAKVEDLNARVADYNRTPSEPVVHLRAADPDTIVKAWLRER